MPSFDSSPTDASEHSVRGADPELKPFIRRRIEETVETAGHTGAEAQRLAAMVCASIDEFLPTRSSGRRRRGCGCTTTPNRYLQTHDSVADARQRLAEIARTESRHRYGDGEQILVRSGLLRRYRGEWVGVNEPNPLEETTITDLALAVERLLGGDHAGTG